MKKKIFSEKEVLEQIKPASRKAYKKCWEEFKEINPEINFEEGPPGEEAIVIFFKHLRFEKKQKGCLVFHLDSLLLPQQHNGWHRACSCAAPVQERIESTISFVLTVNGATWEFKMIILVIILHSANE